jgi:hypothetical protein
VFDWIVMDIIHVANKIIIVPDQVFPNRRCHRLDSWRLWRLAFR